jgi:competence protein ComEC
MGVVQVAGIILVCCDWIGPLAGAAGWLAHGAAKALVDSARLVELTPWLTVLVPEPGPVAVAVYYAALLGAVAGSGALRRCSAAVWMMALAAVCTGFAFRAPQWPYTSGQPLMRVTMFDVGQGDATLVELPDGHTLMADTGGTPFGGGFDIGARVLAPALWARGHRSLDTLLLTHGDPDHVGGALRVVEGFRPTEVWEGVPAPPNHPLHEILRAAQVDGARALQRAAGETRALGDVHLRVMHPERPDWERRRVRNDDSVVVELVYGEVAVLLAGDISAEVERSIAPRLTPARIRILKVAHHGSRTSTSRELLEAWAPHIALIGCGRSNPFGHPAAEVLQRLRSAGTAVYRTDLDGQITVETDGHDVRVRTYVNHEGHEGARDQRSDNR